MDAKILLAVTGFLVASAVCQSSPEPPAAEDPNFVPGVFISADALKSLQEKVKKPEIPAETEAPKVSKKSEEITDQPNPGYQPNQQMPDQQLNQPNGNQPGYQVYEDQPIINQPGYVNQQPNLPNQQPVYNQQPGYNQQPVYNLQPGYNQPLGYQQPGYQQSGYQQPGYQQPGYQQPGYQQNGMGVQQYPPNQQAILVAQQPGYQNQQGMPTNQPTYQQPLLIGQQPNQQLFIPNNGQPTMVANPNMVGQPMGTNPGNGAVLGNPAQSNLYAMVPVNAQNTMPNPNNNNNAYFVPVQVPQNAVLMGNGK